MHETLIMLKSRLSLFIFINISLFSGIASCQSTPDNNSNHDDTDTINGSNVGSSIYKPASSETLTSTGRKTSTADEGRLTNEEVIGELDAELDQSIADFDGMIVDERAKTEAISGVPLPDEGSLEEIVDVNETLFDEGDLSEGLPGYGDFPDSEEEDEEEVASTDMGLPGDQGNTEGESASSNENNGSSKSSGSGQGSSGTGQGVIPQDIDDGSDDDIVARQIREAALKEKDPAFREKLWDEYRRYKNQQRAN